MRSRQPLNTASELWHVRRGEVYVLRFRPDQRFETLMCLDNWFRKGLVTRAQYRTLHWEIVSNTWEFVA